MGDVDVLRKPGGPDGWALGGAVVAAGTNFAISGAFLLTWIRPYALEHDAVRYGVITMLLEFIVMHSSGFLAGAVISRESWGKKASAFALLMGFYSLFAGGFSLAFKTWWPILTFWGLSCSKVLDAFSGRDREVEKAAVAARWGASALAYIAFCFLTVLPPIPRLGITSAVVRSQDLAGEGVWVDEPHRAIAFGFLYFAALGVAEILICRRARSRERGGTGK